MLHFKKYLTNFQKGFKPYLLKGSFTTVTIFIKQLNLKNRMEILMKKTKKLLNENCKD